MTADQDLRALTRDLNNRSPLRSSLLLFAIIACIGCILIWAWFTKIDNVTRADGQIVPSGDVQVVQSPETGVLSSLLVSEGEIVEAGALLMQLDQTMVTGELKQIQQRITTLTAKISRLRAEMDDAETLVFSQELMESAPETARFEIALFQARKAELRSEVEVLERQYFQREQEMMEAEIRLENAQTTLELIAQEMAIIDPLVQRKLEPEISLLALKRTLADEQSAETQTRMRLTGLEAGLAEIKDRITMIHASRRAETLAELATATGQLSELDSRLSALSRRVSQTDLRAPVCGIINQLYLNTLGGVAAAGEPLADIIPIEDSYLVEAYLRPDNIAFIHPGQKVRVKITAYDFSRYGGLEGELQRIGADAIRHSDRDENVFVAQIRIKSNLTDADGEVIQIIPGMVAEIDILAGQRTVLEYLTTPILRFKERAFQE